MRNDQKAVHYALQDWGAWEEKQLDKSFYAAITPLYRVITEGNSSKPEFKSLILHKGTPLRILTVSQAIRKLSMNQQQIVSAQYIFHIKPQGGLWTIREKAEMMGFTYQNWQTSLHRIRADLYKSMGLHYL